MRTEPLVPSFALIAQRSKAARGKEEKKGYTEYVDRYYLSTLKLAQHIVYIFYT